MVNYIIGDTVNRIKMSNLSRKTINFFTFNNRLSYTILRAMKDLGYIHSFYELNFKYIIINIFYFNNISIIKQLFIISRPSLRVYFSGGKPDSKSGNNYGIFVNFTVFTTSKGILTDLEGTFLNFGGEPVLGVN